MKPTALDGLTKLAAGALASYYAAQRRSCREAHFNRIHGNRWQTSVQEGIPPEMWDAAVDPELRPVEPGDAGAHETEVFVGCDASYTGDCSAIVAVERQGPHIRVVCHKVWKPTKTEPLDLEQTIEKCLRELCANYSVRKILADPFQMHRSIVTLQRAGLPVEGYAQTAASTSLMAQVVWDLLREGKLYVYPSEELRAHALNANVLEGPHGFRFVKATSSRKIDALIALCMAAVAATSEPARIPAPLAW